MKLGIEMNEDQSSPQPQADNSIRSVSGTAIPGNRVRVMVELSENHSKPNLCLILSDASGREVSRSIIMAVVGSHIEFTLHIRIQDALLPLMFTAKTCLEDDLFLDSKSVEIGIE